MKIKLDENVANDIREMRDNLDVQHGVKDIYHLRFGLIAFRSMTGFTNSEIWYRFREPPYCVDMTYTETINGILDTGRVKSMKECPACS